MWIVKSVKQYLINQGIKFRVRQLPPFRDLAEAQRGGLLEEGSVVKTVLLHDDFGLIMVVLPAQNALDVPRLRQLLKRELAIVEEREHQHLLKGMHPHFTPPLCSAYGIKSIVDEEIIGHPRIFFPAGDNTHLIETDLQNFHLLAQNATFLHGISRFTAEPAAAQAPAETKPAASPLEAMQRRLAAIQTLPAMPDMARRLLLLKNNPYAHVDDLAQIVALDPSLTLQVVHYANSPLYGYGSNTSDLRQAIQRLGFDMVLHLCLGIAACRSFRLPANGIVGLEEFWRLSLLGASLNQGIARALPKEMRPQSGVCHLAGLLHDFGLLLLGHLFAKEFATLGEVARSWPQASLVELEMELLGFHHGHLGAALLENWGFTDELVIPCREHHNGAYHGPHATLTHITQLSDQLLAEAGVNRHCPPDPEARRALAQALHLDEKKIGEIAQHLLGNSSSLTSMALHLAA